MVEQLAHIVFLCSSLLHQSVRIRHQITVNLRSVRRTSHLKTSFCQFLHEYLASYFEYVLCLTFQFDCRMQLPDHFFKKLVALVVAEYLVGVVEISERLHVLVHLLLYLQLHEFIDILRLCQLLLYRLVVIFFVGLVELVKDEVVG